MPPLYNLVRDRDTIHTAVQSHTCHYCKKGIAKGEKVIPYLYNELELLYFHPACRKAQDAEYREEWRKARDAKDRYEDAVSRLD